MPPVLPTWMRPGLLWSMAGLLLWLGAQYGQERLRLRNAVETVKVLEKRVYELEKTLAVLQYRTEEPR